MEIRCDNCSHVGPAAEARSGVDGVVLVCENCEHENVVAIGVNETSAPPSEGTVDPAAESGAVIRDLGQKTSTSAETDARSDSFGSGDQVRMWLREDALKALIPEPGVGPRCHKCANVLPPHADNCKRCGLNRVEADRHPQGQAPWEQPPKGKEAEQEQAELLWQSFADDASVHSLDKFVDFVREEGLLDFGIRKLRFYLVDHPGHEEAVEHLRNLAESLQSKLIVAQVQARASADEFQEDVSRFRNRMLVGVLVFWGGIFLLFLMFFWDNCASGVPHF